MWRARNRFQALLRCEGPFEARQRKVKKPVPYLPVNSFQNLEPYKSEMFCLNQIRIFHEWKVHFYFRRTILCQGRLLTTAWRKFEKLIYIEYCSMYSSAPSCCGDHGEHLALCHNLPLLWHVNVEFNKVVHQPLDELQPPIC